MRCAVYCRLSLDRTGEELGVERQLADCRDLVARRGGTVVAEHADNSKSATSGRRRPAYAELLAQVERGEVDAIVAWSLDRLVRRIADLEALVDLCDRKQVAIVLVRGSELDLSTPAGRLVARLLGAVARHEVDAKSDRQKREALQRADRGAPPGGRRAFGYRGTDVVPEEADAVRDAYKRLIAGTTLSRIARDMTAAGHRTTIGNPWTINAVRAMLVNPRYAGHRTYLGRIHGPAAWPAIVDETTWEAAHALLTDPARKVSRTNALTWLGTGLYRCGRCPDQTVICTYRGIKARGTQRRVYRCPKCFMTRVADPIDRWVTLVVVKRLRKPDLADLLATESNDSVDAGALSTEAKALRIRLNALADNLELSETVLARRERKIRERLAEIERQLADAGRGSAAGAMLSAPDPGQAWLDLDDLARRQAVVRDLVTIRLLQNGPGNRPFDPESVDIR